MATINTKLIQGAILQAEFCAAVDLIRNYQGSYTPTVDEKLQFYGLFKQATAGDCVLEAPGFFRGMTARYKWEAWSKLSGKASTEAAAEYVALLSQGWPEWREATLKGISGKNGGADSDCTLPALVAAGSSAEAATPPPSAAGALPSTAPAAAATARGGSDRKALSERMSRLRSDMQASMSAVQSLEASVAQLEQRQTPAKGTPRAAAGGSQQSPAQSPPNKTTASGSTRNLVASVAEQASRIAAVAASGRAADATGRLQALLQQVGRLAAALWRRILACIQPVLLAAATVLNASRLQQLLPALLKLVYAAVRILSGVVQGILARAGLSDAARWVKVAAQQLHGGLKALESKLPPGAAGVVLLCCLLPLAFWLTKDVAAQVLVWFIA